MDGEQKKIQANNDFSSHSSFYASSKHHLGDFLKHFASCSHSMGSYGAQISSQSARQKHCGPQHGCTGVTLIPATFRASSPGRKPAWVCARNSPKPLPPLALQAPLRPRTLRCRGTSALQGNPSVGQQHRDEGNLAPGKCLRLCWTTGKRDWQPLLCPKRET